MIPTHEITSSQAVDNHIMRSTSNFPDIIAMNNTNTNTHVSTPELTTPNDNFNINDTTAMNNTHTTSNNTNPDISNTSHDALYRNDGTLFLSNDSISDKNEPWGDPLCSKPVNTIRVYFQNIHGILYQKSWNKWKEIVDMLHQQEVDVAGFVETNINWSPTNCSTARSILRTRNKNSVMKTTNSDDPTISIYQPGGMNLILQNNIIGAIDSSGNDARGLGRWSFSIINGKQQHKLVLITAYRLSQDTIPGDDTIYAQQYRILRRQQIHNPKPKKIFDDDLCKQLNRWSQLKYDILLMIDANTDTHDRQLQRIMNSANLYDILSAKHGLHSPPTYVRGTKTIDHIFGTKRVVAAVRKCGLRVFNADIMSDHRALWLDLDIKHILSQTLQSLHQRKSIPTTKNKKWSISARKHTSTILYNRLVPTDIEQLFTDIENEVPRSILIDKLEQIDNTIYHAMISSVKLNTKQCSWWSPKLHHAMLVNKYWLLRKTKIVTGISISTPMNTILSLLPPRTIMPNVLQQSSLTKNIKNATQSIRAIKLNDKQHRQQFLTSKSLQYKLQNDTKLAHKINNLQKSEIMPAVYRKIKAYLNPTTYNHLHFVDINSPTGPVRVTKKEQLEQTLLNHHKAHFSQAKNTPLAHNDVIQRFGLATDTEHASNFRQGDNIELTYWTDPTIKSFLTSLMPNANDPPQIDTHITVEDVKHGFKIWREATSTSPSGRKLPLYKIWLQPDETHPDTMPGG